MKILPIAAAATLLLAAAPAHAAPYRVYACDGPDDGPLSMHAFTQLELPDRTVNHDDLCREPYGLAGFGLSSPAALMGGWTLRAPAGTTLTQLRWNGGTTGLTGSRIEVEVETDRGLAARWTTDLRFDTRQIPLPAGASYVALRQVCNWPCRLGAWTSIRALSATIDDPRPPAASGFAGLPSTAHGPAVLTFDAADEGSGLARAVLLVDGTVRATALACPPLPGDEHGYAAAQPCPLHAPLELTWATAGARDGAHTVSARLEDAAGTASTVLGPLTVTTDNAPPLPGHVAVSGTPRAGMTLKASAWGFDGQDVEYTYRWQRCPAAGDAGSVGCEDVGDARGVGYSLGAGDVGARVRAVVTARDLGGATTVAGKPSAVVAAAPVAPPTPEPAVTPTPAPVATSALATTPSPAPSPPAPLAAPPPQPRVSLARRTIRARYGQRVEVRGRAVRPDGAPLAGAVLDVRARVRVPGARARRVGSVGTADDGRFSYVAPRGPSRVIAIGGRAVTVLVRAAGTLTVTEHGVTGRLKGGHVPRGGVLVELVAGRRRVLVRTDRDGAFKARIQGTPTRVRARARGDSAWPFVAGPIG